MNDVQQGWFWRMHRGEEPPPPVSHLLGQVIKRVDLDAGELEADFVAAPSFANPAGFVQGGMLGAMLDALTAGLVDATLLPSERVVSLNLNLAFLRPANVGAIQGQASLSRRGRQVSNVQAQLLQHGKVMATATAVCMVVPARDAAPPLRARVS